MGVILGNPTSLSVKYWTGQLTAIDASIGYRYGSSNDIYLNTDFLFHLWAIQKDEGLIRFYFGAGAGLGFISDLSCPFGRPVVPLYSLTSTPWSCLPKLSLHFRLIGDGNIRFRMEAYIGARWYF